MLANVQLGLNLNRFQKELFPLTKEGRLITAFFNLGKFAKIELRDTKLPFPEQPELATAVKELKKFQKKSAGKLLAKNVS